MNAVCISTFTFLTLVAGGNAQDEKKEVDRSIFEERCKYFGDNDSYENYQVSSGEFKYCFHSLINHDEIKNEMDKAKISGDLDDVFMKYCSYKPHVVDCTEKWVNDTVDCLSPEERANVGFVKNVTAAAFDFACAHRGERIAFFLGEGGGECMTRSEIQEEIKKCNQFINPFYETNLNRSIEANSTYYQYPYLRLHESDCEKLEDFRRCIVTALDKCSDPTPSNFADSLFRYVFKRTKCKAMQGSAAVPNSSVFTVLAFVIISMFKMHALE